MLSAHFQGFCRDLYVEAAEAFIRMLPAHLIDVARVQCSAQIALGTGNPNLQSLSRDFDRFDLTLKPALDAGPANALRLNHLALLNQWRNFVVHYGVNPPPGPPLDLPAVRAWLGSCDGLASELDRIVYDHMRGLLGVPPW